MRKIDLLLEEYGESHLNKINKLIHWICVPAIFFSIVGLVWSIPIGFLQEFKINNFQYVNWATLTLCIVLLYYILLSPSLTIGMLVFSIGCLYFANTLENLILADIIGYKLWIISIIIFTIAWILQFIGHKIEGKTFLYKRYSIFVNWSCMVDALYL